MLLAAVVGAASSDPWGTGTTSTGAHPDEDPHTWCFGGSVGDDAAGNISNAENNALDPTQARARFNVNCDLAGPTETDVVWRQRNLAGSATGQTYCEDSNGSHCDQNYSELDMREIRKGRRDEIDETQTACHELGHSAGLTHGDHKPDCMVNTRSTPPKAKKYRRYGQHHRRHINRWF